MKKITHIIDGLAYGGAERIVQALALGMHGAYEVEVITLSRTPLEGQEIAMELLQAGVRVTHIPKRSKIGSGLFMHLVHYLQRTNPDVVHTHLFAADVWGGRAAHRAHVPVILSTEHNINNNEGPFKEWLKSRMHDHRDAVVAISQAVENYIIEMSPSTEKRIRVIPNGVNVQRFSPVATQRSQQLDTAAWENKIQAAIVGRLEKQKGHKRALYSFAQIDQPFDLNIVGEGSQRGELLRIISDLDMEDRVTISPAREDIENLYAGIQVLCVPSLWEGFGLVVVEAMAAGVVVLAQPVDGIAEILQDGVNGLHVDFQDPQSLTTALERLQSDPALRAQIQAAAQNTAERYSNQVMVEQYEGLYHSLWKAE